MQPPAFISYRALLSDGLTSSEIQAMRRDGSLRRVRRGSYLSHPDAAATPEAEHRELALATWTGLAAGSVLSHLSAAIVHGLPVIGRPPSRVSVTRTTGGHGRADTLLHLRVCPLPPDEVIERDGVMVTSLARTVADVTRTSSLDQAVAVADAALRAGLERGDLERSLGRCDRRPGIAQARRVAAFADPGADGPGESVSRVRMRQAGLPSPVLQWRIGYSDGHETFSDFAWPELRTLGEFDGKVKYGRLVKPDQSPTDVVMAEKRRENRIRRQGWWLVRWGWDDLADVRGFERLIRDGFANAPTMR